MSLLCTPVSCRAASGEVLSYLPEFLMKSPQPDTLRFFSPQMLTSLLSIFIFGLWIKTLILNNSINYLLKRTIPAFLSLNVLWIPHPKAVWEMKRLRKHYLMVKDVENEADFEKIYVKGYDVWKSFFFPVERSRPHRRYRRVHRNKNGSRNISRQSTAVLQRAKALVDNRPIDI